MLTWISDVALASSRGMVAVQISLLCASAAVSAPIYKALLAGTRAGPIMISRCVDDQGGTTTSMHAIATCNGRQHRFDTLKMDWVEVIPRGRFVEG